MDVHYLPHPKLECRNKQIEFIAQMFVIGFYSANLSKHKC